MVGLQQELRSQAKGPFNTDGWRNGVLGLTIGMACVSADGL